MRPLALLALAGTTLLACGSSPATTTGSTSGGGGAGGTGGAPPTGPITGSVTRYTYAFDVTTAKAHSALEIDVAAPGGDCFQVPDLAATTAVGWNGGDSTSAAFASGALQVCGAGVAAGGTLKLTADAAVATKTFLGLDVGFSRRKDQDGGEFTYLMSWVGGCDHFGPCDDDPSRLAAFHFDVTHPSGTTVLCPGVLTDGDTVTRCDLAGTLAPTYSGFGLAADPLWKRSPFVTAAGLDLVFYETPSGGIAASLDSASVAAYITWITGLLGPFPYGKEIRYAGAPTVWLGFEHPANIILQEDLQDVTGSYLNPSMHVLMHETVHQWSGDRSTIATAADFVWKEATAEYLSYVFEDEHRPAAEAAGTLDYWDAISLQSQHYPRPTDDPPPPVESFYGDVYGPGPMVLYVQLEAMLGRQTVLDGIKAFLAEPGARSVDDLEKALSKSAGKDLSAYFAAWVFGKGAPEWPTFAVTTAQAGDQVTVTVTQQNASTTIYGCKVDVEVDGATQKAVATIDFGVAPTSAVATATVTLAEAVTGTVLDPGHRVIGRLAGTGNVKAPPPRKVWIL
jgi:aminopeptidase N